MYIKVIICSYCKYLNCYKICVHFKILYVLSHLLIIVSSMCTISVSVFEFFCTVLYKLYRFVCKLYSILKFVSLKKCIAQLNSTANSTNKVFDLERFSVIVFCTAVYRICRIYAHQIKCKKLIKLKSIYTTKNKLPSIIIYTQYCNQILLCIAVNE